MAIPDFQSLMLPFLRLLADGAERSMREVTDRLSEQFGLTPEELAESIPSGRQKVFYNRVAWAKTHLKNAGLLDNEVRGRVRLTALGKSVLDASPASVNTRFLKQFDSYRVFSGSLEPDEGEARRETSDDERATPLETFEDSYSQMRAALAEELRGKLLACPPRRFEEIVIRLLNAMGYGGDFGESRVTPYGRDGGIDGIIHEDKLGLDVICVQAKRWQSNVSRPTIQAFVGSMDPIRAKKGVVITTSEFTDDAKDFVDRIEGKRVVLIDGRRLAELMIEHDVGVTTKGAYLLKEVSDDFFEDESL